MRNGDEGEIKNCTSFTAYFLNNPSSAAASFSSSYYFLFPRIRTRLLVSVSTGQSKTVIS
jgi:hypothetical protein